MPIQLVVANCLLSACLDLQARGAISSYGVHLVVANELHSRKDRVWLVAGAEGAGAAGTGGGDASAAGSSSGGGGGPSVRRIDRPAEEPVIESRLVAEVVAAHRAHVAAAAGGGGDGR